MKTVGNTFVWSRDQAAVVQAVVRSFGGDPARSLPETERLRRRLGPYRPVLAASPASGYQEAFHRIVTNCFWDVRPAVFVSPSVNGWVGVYDQSLEGDDDPQPELARALSRELQTTAVSFWLLYDDLFRFFLVENGKLRDEYMYCANSLDREELAFLTGRSLAGNPRLVSKLCGQPAAERALTQLLGDETLQPPEVFEGVASALNIPLWPFSHQDLIDQPSCHVPACWNQFVVVTQGQLNYVPA